MKAFRTEIKVLPSPIRMGLKSTIITQGSCFSEAIGNRLAQHKLRTLFNPFGVIYNPESIHKVLTYSIFNEPLPEHTYLRNHDVHFNYDVHSAFSALKREDLARQLTNSIGATHYFLKDADWLLLTYGTSWVYQRNDTGEVVANCHKLPAAAFRKSLMDVEAIQSSFKSFYAHVKKFNAKIKILLTVSPVRHLKDTLELNGVSKSILRVACHHLSHIFPDVEYFPAYEMMIDDLRDYRFYKVDMLHPTEEAEDYIWQKFVERYFSPDLQEFAKKWNVVVSAIRHKPFHPETASHQQFLKDTLKKLEELGAWVNVEEEMKLVKRQLIK